MGRFGAIYYEEPVERYLQAQKQALHTTTPVVLSDLIRRGFEGLLKELLERHQAGELSSEEAAQTLGWKQMEWEQWRERKS